MAERELFGLDSIQNRQDYFEIVFWLGKEKVIEATLIHAHGYPNYKTF